MDKQKTVLKPLDWHWARRGMDDFTGFTPHTSPWCPAGHVTCEKLSIWSGRKAAVTGAGTKDSRDGWSLLHSPLHPCLHLPSGTLLVLTAGETTVAKSVTFRIHFNEAIFGGSLGFCNIQHLKRKRVTVTSLRNTSSPYDSSHICRDYLHAHF